MGGGVIIKIYHTLGGQYLIHGREFPKGTVVLQLKNGTEFFCSSFNTARSRDLLVLVYDSHKKNWKRVMMKNEYTELMWDYYRKNKKKIKTKEKNKKHYVHKENKKGTKPVAIPDSVRWAAKHPYQGGGVSPR